MNESLTAVKNLEAQLGQELSSKLLFDQSNAIEDDSSKQNEPNIKLVSVIKYNILVNGRLVNSSTQSPEELKKKTNEYYHIEENQANLLKILNDKVYKKFQEENEKKQFNLCDQENMVKIFFVIVELSKFSELVHGEIASKLKERIINEWNIKPFFGDILIERYQFYKVYSSILRRFPDCQFSLSYMLKKKPFANYIRQLLESESIELGNMNRIDILLDRLVDFPRRSLQLLESYLNYLDLNSQEYKDIKKVVETFERILLSSNNELNKTMNFQQCYNLQYLINDANRLNLFQGDRFLIKQGPIYKVSKKTGKIQLRHLSLFSDMLLVCKVDKLKKSLKLNYKIKTQDIKLIENISEKNSNDEDEFKFQIISSQNNQFIADSKRHKEDWLKAFRRVKNLKIIQALVK